MKIYSIFDRKAGYHSSVTCYENDDLFKRAVSDLVNAKGILLSTHADDFDLYSLGEFDSKTGVVSPEMTFICGAASLKVGGDV